ncbi:hypothetical protein ABE10_10835 [Bacillus toyonensis]|nr:hypothetical protein [Bacillus toyonensis]
MSGIRSAFLFQEVDDEEQGDPDHVDEVPVVGHHDRGGGLLVREVLHGVGASDDEEERDEPTGDVQRVEAGREIEGGGVGVGGDRHPLRDELRVLPDLAGHEDRAEDEGQPEPLDHAPAAAALRVAGRVGLHPLGGEHAHLAGHRGQHQDDRVDRGVRDVQQGRAGGPELR